MMVPFLDLIPQYKSIQTEVDGAIKRVLDRQFFILGEELEKFEEEFAKYLGIKYAVGVNSGTDALFLSLLALGIGKDDEVITPANSFIATATAITQTGAKPILVDCDPDTYEINVDQVRKAITTRTKAIIPVHLYGAPSQIEEVANIARENNLFLVEDAAQAHGATYKNKKLGTFGDLGAFSFYPGKNLGAYGDGGAIVTNDQNLYEKLLKLRNHGQVKKYVHDGFGINSRLDEIQAAVLRVKLKYLDDWNQKRNTIANEYNKELKGFKTQKIVEEGTSCYHIFAIEAQKREELQKYLLENEIHSLIHYPTPIHLQKAYEHLGYKIGDFPVAEKLASSILSIPMYAELTDDQVDHVVQKLNSFINE